MLTDVLKVNKGIRSLRIMGTEWSFLVFFFSFIVKRVYLGTSFSSDGFQIFADGLKANHMLAELDFSGITFFYRCKKIYIMFVRLFYLNYLRFTYGGKHRSYWNGVEV